MTSQCLAMHTADAAPFVFDFIAPSRPYAPLARVCVLRDNRRLRKFICDSLSSLAALSGEELVAQRYERFRALGSFDSLSSEERDAAVAAASEASKPR